MTCAFSWSAWKPGCKAILRHRFNSCSWDLRNAIPACQKKVNEWFSCSHNHVSVTFGNCELMPEIFGGYPLWSSLIHNQCPINLQEPNYNDYWPFPTHTKSQCVTVMLVASGYSPIYTHICTSSNITANNGLSSAVWGIFHVCSPESRATASRFMNFLMQKKFGADSRCSFATRQILPLHLLRFLFI